MQKGTLCVFGVHGNFTRKAGLRFQQWAGPDRDPCATGLAHLRCKFLCSTVLVQSCHLPACAGRAAATRGCCSWRPAHRPVPPLCRHPAKGVAPAPSRPLPPYPETIQTIILPISRLVAGSIAHQLVAGQPGNSRAGFPSPLPGASSHTALCACSLRSSRFRCWPAAFDQAPPRQTLAGAARSGGASANGARAMDLAPLARAGARQPARRPPTLPGTPGSLGPAPLTPAPPTGHTQVTGRPRRPAAAAAQPWLATRRPACTGA